MASVDSWAQDSLQKPYCGFGPVRARLNLTNYPQFKTNNPTTDEGQYFMIPVVVHVIHNGGAENISDAIVRTQIDVLNEDYGHYNRGYNSLPIGADAKIRFYLATTDPKGNPTTGIEHIQSPYTDALSDNEMQTKGLSVWDVNRYLNIWVVKSIDLKATGGREQGYAYLAQDVPSLPDKNADGIMVTYRFFGRLTPYNVGNYRYGRTTSHESGHYFNLLHTWGGDGPGEGGCNDDDHVDDTPDCDGPFYSTFLGGTGDTCQEVKQCGEQRLVADYMDYSEDRCMNIFTKGQIDRMRQAILAYRPSLVTYENVIATGGHDIYVKYNTPHEELLDILPNPSNGTLYLYPNFPQQEDATLYVFDAIGRLVRKVNLYGLQNQKTPIDMIWAANGIYHLELVTPNNIYKQKLVIQHP